MGQGLVNTSWDRKPRPESIADGVVRARPRMLGILLHVESTRLKKKWSVSAGQSDTAREIAMKVSHDRAFLRSRDAYVFIRRYAPGRLRRPFSNGKRSARAAQRGLRNRSGALRSDDRRENDVAHRSRSPHVIKESNRLSQRNVLEAIECVRLSRYSALRR